MPQTCLIAAHDPWFIQLLRIYTEECGLRAVQAYEGQDVLPMIRQEHPVAVLLQVDMPGQVKGWELLHILKEDPSSGKIPVLVFSWQNTENASQLAREAAAYLQEPVTYEAFLDALHKVGICSESSAAK